MNWGCAKSSTALALLPDSPKHLLQRADLVRLEVGCEAGLGNFELAKAAAHRGAAILRSPSVPESERTRAASELGSLGATVWMAGAGDAWAELLNESIAKLEEKGPSSRGDRTVDRARLRPSQGVAICRRGSRPSL